MSTMIDVEFAPRNVPKAVKRGDLIIAVDVLRSSSSIVTALANGAIAVIPTETLKEAYRLQEQHSDYLLTGERKGRKPEGFNLGNSPLEFVHDVVGGKTMILTTTSGTAVLVQCREAEHVLIGAFLNAAAVANKAMEIAQKKRLNVSFVLAGEKGLFSLEDFLCAGAVATKFPSSGLELSDETMAAVYAFERTKNALSEYVMKSKHARHLFDLGFERDVTFACRLDHLGIVPIYQRGNVTLMR